MSGYDPKRSKVNPDRMNDFVNGDISDDLTSVPGIGPAAVKCLAALDEPILTTYQLLGRYLMLKGRDDEGNVTDSLVHNDKFWYFLKHSGLSAHRSGVVEAIARKTNTFLAGMYDPTAYDDSDEEDEE